MLLLSCLGGGGSKRLPMTPLPSAHERTRMATAGVAPPVVDAQWWELVGKATELTVVPLKRRRRGGSGGAPTRQSSPNKKVLPGRERDTSKQHTTTSIRYEDLVPMTILGAGTYGEVKRGFYGKRKVAIKELFESKTLEEAAEIDHDFKREIAILKTLDHPKIVTFIGAVTELNKPRTLVFEFCEGSVAQLLKLVRRGTVQLSFRLCLNIAQDAAEAIHYLHKQRPVILHRDLKAENLLLTRDMTCKLTDFGLSRVFEANNPTIMTVCGTPCWVAPEIFRGEAYCEKADVYSFSITLWELFSAKKPFQDKDCAELPVLVTQRGLRPPLLINVPQELNQLMSDCWVDNAATRPSFGIIRRRLDRAFKEVADVNKLGFPVHTNESFYVYRDL